MVLEKHLKDNGMSYRDRLSEEFRELNTKIDKLELFIKGTAFDGLDEVSQQLLMAQCDAMITYSAILDTRRLRAGGKG